MRVGPPREPTADPSVSIEATHDGTTKKVWRSRVSIPVPPACKAGALPFELHPQGRQVQPES
jgi:hypothetical protein